MIQLVNIKEAAKRTGLSEYELRKGVKQGKYPFIKAGETKYMFNVEALEQSIVQQMEYNQQQAAQGFAARYRGVEA